MKRTKRCFLRVNCLDRFRLLGPPATRSISFHPSDRPSIPRNLWATERQNRALARESTRQERPHSRDPAPLWFLFIIRDTLSHLPFFLFGSISLIAACCEPFSYTPKSALHFFQCLHYTIFISKNYRHPDVIWDLQGFSLAVLSNTNNFFKTFF